MTFPTGTPDEEPSDEDLAAIEREADLIAAEMALLDAELRIVFSDDEPSEIDWQRLHRAARDVLDERGRLDSSVDEDDGWPGDAA